jgi:hypothetical protein
VLQRKTQNAEPVFDPCPDAVTWTESFDQADSTTLGPDLTWTKFPAVFAPDDGETLDGALTFYGGTDIYAGIAGGVTARAEHEVGCDAMYAQAEIVALNATRDLYFQVICRMIEGETYPNHQGFLFLVDRTSGVWTASLYYDAGGVFVATASFGGVVPGDVIRVEYDDPDVRGLVNGVPVVTYGSYPNSFVDPGSAGGVALGIQGGGVFTPGDTALDNFEMGRL